MKYLAIPAVIVLLALSLFSWYSAPCGLWKYEKASETPARCLMGRP